jgi:peptidoglycan/LPS O-acetylase OafA/YrhL
MVGFSFYILPWLAGKQGYSITLPEKPWMYFTFLSNFERSDHLFALQYFWAIAVEEQFYILFLLLSVFFKRWIYGVSLTLFLLFIAGVIIGMQLDWHLYSNPIFHFASFGTGILMAQLYFKNRVPSTKYLLSALTLSVILMYLFFNTDAIRPFRNIPTSFMFGSMILLAIRVFENPAWQKTILFQWTEEAGRYTYGLYVFSGFVITFTGYFLPIKQPVLFLIVEFALLFTLAFLSYHLYEKWFLKLKRFYRPVVSNEQKEQRNSNELISSI